jgi:transposase
MEQWKEIRLKVLRGEASKRGILRQTGMHWKTLEKILQFSEPPGYRMRCERMKPKLGPFLGRIADILEADREVPRKQRHTARRIYERIKEEGYQGKYTVVKDAVGQMKRLSREVFMPLVHRPGEGQADFGHALARVAGQLRRVVFFVMALGYSDAFFVMAFERECTETCWEGHIKAFDFFGGVPRRISYDNSKVMVSKIIGPHQRMLTRGFLQLQSHYLFEEHFCRVRRANEKGVVEALIKYVRLNFFVPVPRR